ncbi:hypothetical protein B0H17DRAFT_1223570 [Mycena rosella]|uniref:Uncharacterized protein n=1 Tax=Mycena rosella TaxID=1033263 RepID=A0AAD7H341_MYCRO|nr:hypothetical protein B0H17DRAFT_1223570 [Mycena rosella]
MWYSSIVRLVSIISVSSVLVWAAAAAPVPDSKKTVLAAWSAADQFTELDLATHGPEESLDTIEARIFSARDSPGPRAHVDMAQTKPYGTHTVKKRIFYNLVIFEDEEDTLGIWETFTKVAPVGTLDVIFPTVDFRWAPVGTDVICSTVCWFSGFSPPVYGVSVDVLNKHQSGARWSTRLRPVELRFSTVMLNDGMKSKNSGSPKALIKILEQEKLGNMKEGWRGQFKKRILSTKGK